MLVLDQIRTNNNFTKTNVQFLPLCLTAIINVCSFLKESIDLTQIP